MASPTTPTDDIFAAIARPVAAVVGDGIADWYQAAEIDLARELPGVPLSELADPATWEWLRETLTVPEAVAWLLAAPDVVATVDTMPTVRAGDGYAYSIDGAAPVSRPLAAARLRTMGHTDPEQLLAAARRQL